MNYLFNRKTLLILYTLGIITISLLPSNGASTIKNLDKLGHFLAYAGMAILIFLTFGEKESRIAGVLGAILLGISLEMAQASIASRDRSFYDVIANTIGVGVGVVISLQWKRPLETLAQAIEEKLKTLIS